jgi:uncharacterized protein YigE (DUF2233 family)
MQMKYQDRTKDLRRRLTKHKQRTGTICSGGENQEFLLGIFPDALGGSQNPGMRRSIPVTRRVGGMVKSCQCNGESNLTMSGKAMVCLVLTLLLAAGGAQAVECTSNALNSGTVTVCRVDLLREQLQLFWRDDAGQPYGQFSALRDALVKRGKTLEFAMNGGMYKPDLSPVGLFVADERELVPLNRHTGPGNFSQQPNGVFLLDVHGARVLTTDEYWREKPKPFLATQSGPMLVHQGELTTSPVMNPESQSRRIRNGVCAPSPESAVFVISEAPVTFHEFAVYFRESLRCGEALYLDGSISSLYAPRLGRTDHWSSMGPIIGVTK